MERERQHRERPQAMAGEGDPSGASLNATRNEMDRLLAAGDDLLKKALSSDSAAFVESSRQPGGQ